MFWIGLAVFVFGYAIGVVVSWMIFKPTKSFDEGYEKARETYTNWNKGFYEGFESGYIQGKNDGKKEGRAD